MASNGANAGNSDYAYLPLGWTCQVLLNTATVNLGYDIKAPDHFPSSLPTHEPAPVSKERQAEIAAMPATIAVPGHNPFPMGPVHPSQENQEPVRPLEDIPANKDGSPSRSQMTDAEKEFHA